jgi:murein DD-endopeptidase MepM/ murein hydrolase activator NlpD
MPRKRRNTRRQTNGYRKHSSVSSRAALSFLAFLGVLIVVGAMTFNFLIPDEIQSSIDYSAMGVAARHDVQPSEHVQPQPGDPRELPVAEAPREPEITRMTGIIKSGDTPSSLLEGCMPTPEIYNLCNESKSVYPLNNLKAGQPWTMIYSGDALVGLEYEIDSEERLVVSMADGGYDFRREAIPYEIETKTVAGVIESSLFGAIGQAGENDELGIRLANVFAYDVDFTRDLRQGDSFKAIIQKRYREGSFVGYGPLIAASFTNQGQTFYAYSYADRNGNTAYYDQNGRPLRKAFLKSPLPFTRISSGYSMSRLHPILKYRRPHQGIDYAAPTGTPISTVADGIVAQVGSNNSQGKFVRVIHSNGYETIYNHMSKFAQVSKKGAKVKQGQVIGYVGSTGYATGPHLDFRMRQNGKLINPLKLKVMPADPIAKKEMPNFKAAIAEWKARLEEPVQSASLNQPAASAQ